MSSLGKYHIRIILLVLLSVTALIPKVANADNPTGRQLIQHIEKLLWGETSQGQYAMTISTPHWQRTLEMHVWMDRPHRTFIRILAPRKEKGVGSLRISDEMWNYLPKVEKTIKVPPSMMLQSWMGSDFSNDDLVKESNAIYDYNHKIISVTETNGIPSYTVQALPKAEAAVVWGKLIYHIRKHDLMPLRQEFYSERNELIKVLSFSEIKEMDGRRLPTLWQMQTIRKPGHKSTVNVKNIKFDRPISDKIFSLRNLRTPR